METKKTCKTSATSVVKTISAFLPKKMVQINFNTITISTMVKA